jgi:hypothetical protein
MKLLDMINPTDYAEMAQNQMEDSRIPVWMVNAEKDNIQVVISQAKENVFAGLNRGTDTAVRHNAADGSDIVGVGTDADSAFLMMGPESITGAKNGFLNIAPDLGSIAGGFGQAFVQLDDNGTPLDPSDDTFVSGDMSGLGNPQMNDLMSAFSVGAFTSPTATLATLSQDFKDMQVGKTMAYWAVGGADFNPATTDDNPDFSDFTDTPNNDNDDGNALTSDTMENMGAYQAGIQTMGFEHLNFSASVVGMACNSTDPDMVGAIAQLSCDSADFIADYATEIVYNDDGDTMTLAEMFSGSAVLDGWAADYASNLSSFGANDGANSAFEYMTGTGFRTFDTFVNARSQYKYSMPSNTDLNLAFRTQESTTNGVNYSLNYSYNYDTNPIIDLSWRNDAGEVLDQEQVSAPLKMLTGLNEDQTSDDYGQPTYVTYPVSYLELTDGDGNVYGGATATAEGQAAFGASLVAAGVSFDNDGNPTDATDDQLAAAGGAMVVAMQTRSAILTFDQQVKRVHNIGGSFDTSIETAALGPVVIRGEALYTKDGFSPVMDKAALSQGDLVGALQMKKADRFKFVLGADITAMTNMLVSVQFIQDSNLDFIDNGDEYTTDYATMHLSNGFQKGTKDKNFYSLFFSKPFGESGQHRWNNITMLEEGVGENAYWNRFDIDYSIDDNTQATLEYNKYWGNVNTQFGQLKNASNIQAGVKYSF